MNLSKTRTWDSATAAQGSLWDDEFDRIYANFDEVKGLFTHTSATIQTLYIDASDNLGIGETAPVSAIELTNASPYFTTHNNTSEDADGGRESRWIARGQQSGAEETILGYCEFSHSGSSDDEKGKFRIYANDGSDGTSPTLAMTIEPALFVMGQGANHSVIQLGDVSNNQQSRLLFTSSSTQKSFQIGFNFNVTGGLEITRSTAAGGTTFSTPDLTINNSGQLGIGKAPAYQLELSTDSAGKPATNTWTIVSDERIKKDVVAYKDGLEKILKMRPVKYHYNGKGGFKSQLKTDPFQVGIIAQEMAKVSPEMTGKSKLRINEKDDEDTEILTYQGHNLAFMQINALKELDARLKKLESK